MRTANWLAQGLILKIEQSCHSIKPNLEEGQKHDDLSKKLSRCRCFVNGKWKKFNLKNSIDKSSYHRFSQKKGTQCPLMD
jgi:hypothetical protein